MKTNTPPMSPGPSDDNEDDENIDLGEIQEVIDLNEVNLEEMTEEEDMEEEETIVDMATTVFSKHEGMTLSTQVIKH
ncbi:hypothetical protein E2C01_061526 [Portunus trituberculatus]|uniref:Uncharacterized protein n=1 Tax=Portunus trituberculatus TaxID=210409 RepID=A0A5B7H437_PORTR|nr:hypothetical protein [Portunus trituberculatus]